VLWLVTGAPGAGKSAIAEALLALPSAALVCDIDWLIGPVSALVGQPIEEARQLWPAYNRLWLAILAMMARNRRPVIFFSPLDRAEVAAAAPAAPLDAHHWCLLDCDDATRTARLAARGWTPAMIAEALEDARTLRDQIHHVIDTSRTTPAEAAAQVERWFLAGQSS
jgi:hypothetical protein